MQIKSTLLGELEIAQEDIITFPDGLPAFENRKEFILVPMDETSPFFYMQSTSDPDICFVLADPFPFFPAYEVELGDEELKKIGADSKENNLSLFTILTIPDDFKKTTANLMAPIIINANRKIGLQFIPANSDYTTKHFIFSPEEKIEPAAGEGL